MLLLQTQDVPLLPLLLVWGGALALGLWFYLRWRRRAHLLRRMYADDQMLEAAAIEDDPAERNLLSRWLYLAGFRSGAAPALFVAATAACGLLGVLLVITLDTSGLTRQAMAAAGKVPSGVGDMASAVLRAAPWLLLGMLLLMPWSYVNSARKRRVMQVEQDMPVTLELLATMSESGLAFDSALERVVQAQQEERPLFRELRTFQLEVLSGVSRVLCFRRLSQRLEVPSMTIFVSALVQAEQVGAGFANVLRSQADDLRNRRREEANVLASALPVKLIFPLVICFLPGIFVTTLGPIFLQFIHMIDGMTRQ